MTQIVDAAEQIQTPDEICLLDIFCPVSVFWAFFCQCFNFGMGLAMTIFRRKSLCYTGIMKRGNDAATFDRQRTLPFGAVAQRL